MFPPMLPIRPRKMTDQEKFLRRRLEHLCKMGSNDKIHDEIKRMNKALYTYIFPRVYRPLMAHISQGTWAIYSESDIDYVR